MRSTKWVPVVLWLLISRWLVLIGLWTLELLPFECWIYRCLFTKFRLLWLWCLYWWPCILSFILFTLSSLLICRRGFWSLFEFCWLLIEGFRLAMLVPDNLLWAIAATRFICFRCFWSWITISGIAWKDDYFDSSCKFFYFAMVLLVYTNLLRLLITF